MTIVNINDGSGVKIVRNKITAFLSRRIFHLETLTIRPEAALRINVDVCTHIKLRLTPLSKLCTAITCIALILQPDNARKIICATCRR